MPTANTYVPVAGTPLNVTSGDGSDIPRNPDSNFQGDPRPAALRHVLLVTSPDPSDNADNQFNVFVPFPVNYNLTKVAETGEDSNSVWPMLRFSPQNVAAASLAASTIFTIGAVDPVARTFGAILLTDAAFGGQVSWFVEIDFLHSVCS